MVHVAKYKIILHLCKKQYVFKKQKNKKIRYTIKRNRQSSKIKKLKIKPDMPKNNMTG